MSQFAFGVKDYRILKDAHVEPEGITLIYAKNGSGKSTLIKSLVSLLSNRHSEDNFRHGQASYSIAAQVDGSRLRYQRDGDSYQIRFNDEAPRSKVGQGAMYAIEPRFPLKRYDFESSSFYPNFSFQNSVPVFDDIDATELFSVMFSDVAKISGRVTELKRDCTNLSKVRNDSQATGDMLKGKVSEAKKAVARFEEAYPGLPDQYESLKGLARKRDEFVKLSAELMELEGQCGDAGKRQLMSLYEDAQPLFKDLVFVQKVQGLLGQKESLSGELARVRGELDPLEELFPADIVSLVDGVGKVAGMSESLRSIQSEAQSLPDIPGGLVTAVASLVSVQQRMDAVRGELSGLPEVSVALVQGVQSVMTLSANVESVRGEMSQCDADYAAVMDQLKAFPCDRFLAGNCPYIDKSRL